MTLDFSNSRKALSNMERFAALQTHADAIATKTGIDINTIMAIIAAVMQAISTCTNPPTPAQLAEADGFAWKIRTNQAMRDNGVRPLSHEGKALSAALREQAAALSETDAATFLSLCQ